MECICVRLTKGDDLKNSIKQTAAEEGIPCGVVLSAVGCLSRAKIRSADGKSIHCIDEPCEIVSVTGTVSSVRTHLHISLAKTDLAVIGGHLMDGCIVNTTCELVIGIVPGHSISKLYDPSTGYDELVFNEE